jgi:rod shape-determining protein MreC
MLHLFADRRYLIVAVIILIITWGMFVTSRERAGEGKIEYFFNTAMAPLESIFNNVGGVINDSWLTITRLGQLKAENDRLHSELSRLKARQPGLLALQEENRRLREALDFRASQPHELVAAETIAANPSNWNRSLIINKGRDSGIQRNMAVISPGGIVGRIGEVRANTAEVILLTDPREGNYIGGVVHRTQDMVIVTGGGYFQGECTVKPAVDSYFINLKKGDLIRTAETSEIFPRGIPIGRIVKVSKGANNLVSKAALKPVVKLGRLEMVYVIKTKKDPPVIPGSAGGQ